jgi:anti-anti-sigma factor
MPLPNVEVDLRGPLGIACVHVSGEVDIAAAPQLEGMVRAIVASGAEVSVVVDLADVTFMDMAGIHALIAAQGALNAAGRTMQVINVRPAIARVMRITGTDAILCPSAAIEPPARQLVSH